ncbi:protein kinase domain-containing protein [Colletotrichum musicola]|uniref:Protein kinase domain-containing protein n=1 Tax=Colletotrichum musicola TaxID=2175873 RepID=A0A8H6JJX1_9PEZI|nr:protein kinase domain-containing protein [Colletotrichum musicola]
MAIAKVHSSGYAHGGDNWVPSYRVFPTEMDMDGQDIPLHEANLTLTGFGAAFRPADKPRFQSQKQYWNSILPSEVYFEPGMPLTFAWDIWSLGNAIFELLARRPLIGSR